MILESDIDQALLKIEKGLCKYCWIQEHVLNCDVRTNTEFRTRFNGFYRVRRNTEWQDSYYALMEASKVGRPDFGEILAGLRDRTNMVEASFVSKLVATLDPDRPVIDQFVLANFGMRLPPLYANNRLAKIVALYDKLRAKYRELMAEPAAEIIRRKFVERYPWAQITDLKKVDLVLWQIRE